jgi:hypothetical protein
MKETTMTHEKLKPNYTLPVVPTGYDCPVVFQYTDGSSELDFLSDKRKNFASEKMKLDLVWPWVDGFTPSHDDWNKIGFSVMS